MTDTLSPECALFNEMRARYLKLISGDAERAGEFQGANTVRRKLEMHNADLRRFKVELDKQEALCAASKGLTVTRRRAFTLGGF
jgi:hypothetical protein